MSHAEEVCRNLIARGKWTKALCQLCRKIHREKCKVIEEMTIRAKIENDE